MILQTGFVPSYAIENEKPIIPVLVAGATAMPVPAALPIPIQPLLEHQWIQLRDENWDYDLERLTGSRISENDIALAKALESAYQQRAK